MAVHKGDIIVAVDGIETRGMSSEDVKTLIMGSPETSVALTLRQVSSYMPKSMHIYGFHI